MSEENLFKEEDIAHIFKMANMDLPENPTNTSIKTALSSIESFLPDISDMTAELEVEYFSGGKVLIVDDIGVINYQLKTLFEKSGFEAETSKDIYTAIKLLRKNTFDYIIMDLFVSTEREGFLFLDETKKIINENNLKTKIIVVTASNTTEHQGKCMSKGADGFIKKEVGWQDALLAQINK